MRRWFLTFVAVAGVALGACGSSAPPKLKGVETTPPLEVGTVTVPDATANNAPFAMKAAPGGLLVSYFGYTSCPDICPTTLSDVAAALDSIGAAQAARVQVAMITVDPERDTDAVLTKYLSHFFTTSHALRQPDPAALAQIEVAFGVRATVAPHAPGESYEIAHTALTYVIDSTGTVVVEWPFGFTSADMANDLRVLLNRERRA